MSNISAVTFRTINAINSTSDEHWEISYISAGTCYELTLDNILYCIRLTENELLIEIDVYYHIRTKTKPPANNEIISLSEEEIKTINNGSTLHQNSEKQNIIFGILTTGEIFVEVNGTQHTPDESFYKLATIESSKLAHQVRDLTLEIEQVKRSHDHLKRKNDLLTNKSKLPKEAQRFIYDLAKSIPMWKGVEVLKVFENHLTDWQGGN